MKEPVKRKLKFTKASVEKLAIPAGETDFAYYDETMTGFGIRFREGGTVGTYFIKYKIGKKYRRVQLGRSDQVTLASAQKEAEQLRAQVSKKVDPAKERAKLVANAEHNIPALVEPFCLSLEEKNRSESWVTYNRKCLTDHWKPLHKYALADIEREHVADRLTWLNKNSGLASSDQCRAVLHRFFNWAIAKGKAKFNPVAGTEANGQRKRSRILKPAELKKVWHGVASDDGSVDDYGRIVRLLILNGQRLSEFGDLNREETNLNKKLIALPGSRTKNGLPHDIPLAAPSIDILRSASNTGGEIFLFGSGKSKTKGYRGWSKSKKELDEKIKLSKPWVHHDLRRSCSTYMRDECKVLPHIVEAVLNHVSGDDKKGVAGVYNQAKYNPEKRDALDKYAAWIMEVVAA